MSCRLPSVFAALLAVVPSSWGVLDTMPRSRGFYLVDQLAVVVAVFMAIAVVVWLLGRLSGPAADGTTRGDAEPPPEAKPRPALSGGSLTGPPDWAAAVGPARPDPSSSHSRSVSRRSRQGKPPGARGRRTPGRRPRVSRRAGVPSPARSSASSSPARERRRILTAQLSRTGHRAATHERMGPRRATVRPLLSARRAVSRPHIGRRPQHRR